MPTFTRADLKARVNAGIKGKVGVLVDADAVINDAVRSVNTDIDLRTSRRKTSIEPGIFDEVLAYPAPTDLKARRLVSIRNQAQENATYHGYNLVPYEQFNQKLGVAGDMETYTDTTRELYTVAFDDHDTIRKMLISAPQSGVSQTLAQLETLTGDGGTWSAYGDATNVVADDGNYVRGTGSLKFDISAAAGTTAGIVNTALTAKDITEYLGTNSSFFTFVYLSDKDDITNFKLRLGNDASNYYELTVTSTHVNTAFATGWNTLRFTASTRTETGTVDPTNIQYVALYMTKLATKVSEQGFRFDHIVARTGTVVELRYYSEYPWQDINGVWLQDSTEDSDLLHADSDEYELFIHRAVALAAEEVDESRAAETAEARYQSLRGAYERGNPSEALVETTDYMAQYFL
jgi:hypothetical protein